MKNHIKLYEDFHNDSQFFKTREEIEAWLNNFNIENYTINDDLTVDVDGGVVIKTSELEYIPVQFGEVHGPFQCQHNWLTNLKGCPKFVGAYFYCYNNKLTSLEGGPVDVRGDFNCGTNKLTELRYGPDRVGGDYDCHHNELKSLVGLPYHTLNGDLNCVKNKLETMEGIPPLVIGKIHCQENNLKSLVHCPKKPWNYYENPCTKIYDELDFTTEAHIQSLLKNTVLSHHITNLKDEFPERYEELIQDKRVRIELGMESEELTSAYNTSKDVEGDFY